MEKFTASDMTLVSVEPDDDLFMTGVEFGRVSFRGEVTRVLREFFLHERDTELCRWRSRPDSNLVVYPRDGGELFVLDEATGHGKVFKRRVHVRESGGFYDAAARAYLDAQDSHRPWLDAKFGEAWVLTVDGEAESLWVCDTGINGDLLFCMTPEDNPYMVINDSRISAGRRIWPEVSGE